MKIPSLVALTCQEVVELITAYMSDDMALEDRARFEQHLHACTWCMTYLNQMRRTVEWTGQLDAPLAVPAVDPALAELFLRWKAEKG